MLPAQAAVASGFLLYEQSAEALAKGGAVTAATREPAAVWFNPAALAFMPARGASVMTAVVHSQTTFSPSDGSAAVTSRPGNNVVPNIFAHAAVGARVHAGIGLFAPFGLAVHWPDGWAGAEKSLTTSLRFIVLNPTIALRLHDTVAVAAGIGIVRGDIGLATALPSITGGRVALAGGGWGHNLNVALLYRPWPDRVHLALTYRGRVPIALQGRADFSPEKPGFETIYADQGVASSITLPAIVTVGVMVRAHPRLELSAEVNQVRWASFDRLVIDFEHGTTPDRIIDRDSRNALTGRFGGTWSTSVPGLVVRAGTFLAQNTTPSTTQVPAAPDGNRVGVGAGIGYSRGHYGVDVGYVLLHLLAAASVDAPVGTYRSRVHALALTFSAR